MWRSYGALAQQWRYRLQHEQRELLVEGLARAGCAMLGTCTNIDESVIFSSWPPGAANYSGKIAYDHVGERVEICAQLLKEGVHCERISCALVHSDDEWLITSWSVA